MKTSVENLNRALSVTDRQQLAQLLVDAFRDTGSTAWKEIQDAYATVDSLFKPENLNLIARSENGKILGWIGSQPAYKGASWELHPLAICPTVQKCGLGRLLVTALEEKIASLGGGTVFLGTDDENHRTSLSSDSLFPNVLSKLQSPQNLGSHPSGFYQACGYEIVGAIPDANGPGKPDILMAKSISPKE